MKIVVVNPSLFTPFYDYHYCKALVESGDLVTMVGRPPRQHERPADGSFAFAELFYRRAGQREAGSPPSQRHRIRKGLEHATGLWALEKLVTEQHADIVHFQWLVLPFLDRIALGRLHRRCGLVLTVHNAEISAHDVGAAVGRFGAFLQGLDQRRAVLSFVRYIVHSDRTLQRLLGLGVASEKIIHLPHPPLELDAPIPLPVVPKDGDRRDILFFGNIKPYKGVETLIEAGIALAATRRDFRITIAGRPSHPLDALRARIASSDVDDVFRFDLEYLSDAKLSKYLAAASVVVFPYRDIDGSGALSHAIRFEKPIVASRVGGFAESPFKDHIELVPPGDAAALAATLAGLLDNPAQLERLSYRSRILRATLPSWADFARSCRQAYSDIETERAEHGI